MKFLIAIWSIESFQSLSINSTLNILLIAFLFSVPKASSPKELIYFSNAFNPNFSIWVPYLILSLLSFACNIFCSNSLHVA